MSRYLCVHLESSGVFTKCFDLCEIAISVFQFKFLALLYKVMVTRLQLNIDACVWRVVLQRQMSVSWLLIDPAVLRMKVCYADAAVPNLLPVDFLVKGLP